MRSEAVTIELNRDTDRDYQQDNQFQIRRLVVEPDGSFRYMRYLGEGGATRLHLDTDDGFARFVSLIKESAALDKIAEIKNTLNING